MAFEAGRYIREIELDGAHPMGNPILEIILWRAKFGSELVLCDGDGIPLAAFPVRESAADADFTALVSWAGFDPDDLHRADLDHEPRPPVLAQIRSAIRDHLAEQARERTVTVAQGRRSCPLSPVG